jgi:preprotein translocase subunit SecG
MTAPQQHADSQIEIIKLRKQIAELEIQEETANTLSVVTLVLGFVFTIIAIIL